jgi:hypothetical protein
MPFGAEVLGPAFATFLRPESGPEMHSEKVRLAPNLRAPEVDAVQQTLTTSPTPVTLQASVDCLEVLNSVVECPTCRDVPELDSLRDEHLAHLR